MALKSTCSIPTKSYSATTLPSRLRYRVANGGIMPSVLANKFYKAVRTLWALWLIAITNASLIELAHAQQLESLQSQSIVVLATLALVVACVVVHYEALSGLTTLLKRITLKPRQHILLLIFAILFLHVIEVWIFGIGYYALITTEGHGMLVSNHSIGFLDCIYYSAVCFTTLGLGDVVPVGAVRFVTGSEALTGFVLLTWSASFTFVEMQRFWKS